MLLKGPRYSNQLVLQGHEFARHQLFCGYFKRNNNTHVPVLFGKTVECNFHNRSVKSTHVQEWRNPKLLECLQSCNAESAHCQPRNIDYHCEGTDRLHIYQHFPGADARNSQWQLLVSFVHVLIGLKKYKHAEETKSICHYPR